MSEHDDEREARRLYHELPREEPPAALDAKLRAEARRALVTHPAPLVAPTGRRSWYFPVAAAAVIVLAVAVTWQVEREQPDDGAPLPQSAPAPELRKEKKLPEQAQKKQPDGSQYAPLAKRAEKQPEETKSQAPAEAARDQALSESAKEPTPAAKPSAPPASVSGTLAQSRDREDALGQRENRMRQERPAAAAAAPAPQSQLYRDEVQTQSGAVQAPARAKTAEEPPEKWLERIAQLRREGRHDEADQALAQFRKRYPDYRIPAATLEKVERR